MHVWKFLSVIPNCLDTGEGTYLLDVHSAIPVSGSDLLKMLESKLTCWMHVQLFSQADLLKYLRQ